MADINVKMGVSGASQFQQQMRQSASAVKTLDAELKLAEAEYKATGDQEAYMQKKTELLRKKLKEQESVVANAEGALKDLKDKGYSDTSTQVQQFRQKLIQAKTQLVQTQSELDGTTTDVKELGDQAVETNSAVEDIGKNVSLQTLRSGIDGITQGLETAAKKAFGLMKALADAGRDAASWADELLTQSSVYEIDTQTLQQWRYASNFVDTNVETIIAARQKMIKAMSGSTDAFDELGVATRDSEGNLRNSTDVMWDALAALSQIDNMTERDAAAMKVFGKSAAELNPLIEAGRATWEEYANSAPLVSEENITALGKADDAIQDMNAQLETLRLSVLAELAPVLEVAANAISSAAQDISDYLATPEGQAAMEGLKDALIELVNTLTSQDFTGAIDTAKSMLEGITGAFKWVSENSETVVGAVKAIAAAYGLLKVSSGVLRFMELANGAKGLFNGGGGGNTPTQTVPTEKTPSKARQVWDWSKRIMPEVLPFMANLAAGGLFIGGALAYGAQSDQAYTDKYFGGFNDALEHYDEIMSADHPGTEQMKEMFNAFVMASDQRSEDDWVEKTMAAWDEYGDELLQMFPELNQYIYDNMKSDDWAILGAQAATGLANGIRSKESEAVNAASHLAKRVKDTVTQALDINSPSKVMAQLGGFVGEGFAQGIDNSLARVEQATGRMADAVIAPVARGGGSSSDNRSYSSTMYIGNYYQRSDLDVQTLAQRMEAANRRSQAGYGG